MISPEKDAPLTPKQLAQLAIEARPVLDLLRRAAPHLTLLLKAGEAMSNWHEVEGAIEAARQAPADFQAEFHHVIWARLSNKYEVGSPEFWGALALELKTATPTPAPTPDPVPVPVPEPTPLPEPQIPTEQPTPAPSITPPGLPPMPVQVPIRYTPEYLTTLKKVEYLMNESGLSAKEVSEKLSQLGTVVNPNSLSSIKTGWTHAALTAGRPAASIAADKLRDIVTFLEDFVAERKKAALLPDEPDSIIPARVRVDAGKVTRPAALPATKKERKQAVLTIAQENGGVITANQICTALGVRMGAVSSLMTELQEFRYDGRHTYKLISPLPHRK